MMKILSSRKIVCNTTKIYEQVEMLAFLMGEIKMYNRDNAVKYAIEHYNGWDENKFPNMDEDAGGTKDSSDCANFVSQCLYAGGAIMQKSNDKYADWWCYGGQLNNKGHAWADAQSLRRALKTQKIIGLRTTFVANASELKKGDLIFIPRNEDLNKSKSNMRAKHVMILVEDGNDNMVKVCQRGQSDISQRCTYKKIIKKHMIFAHVTGSEAKGSQSVVDKIEKGFFEKDTRSIEERVEELEERVTKLEDKITEYEYDNRDNKANNTCC